MSASMYYKPETKFTFQDGNPPEILFTIRADGTIERGPAFTTTDEMSLKFWEAVENLPRAGEPRPGRFWYDQGVAATIERCAQVADSWADLNRESGLAVHVLTGCAAAIRALKDKP